MSKKPVERRVYTKEFKAGAVALVGKKDNPVSQVAKDLGINENMLREYAAEVDHHGAGGGWRRTAGVSRTREAAG